MLGKYVLRHKHDSTHVDKESRIAFEIQPGRKEELQYTHIQKLTSKSILKLSGYIFIIEILLFLLAYYMDTSSMSLTVCPYKHFYPVYFVIAISLVCIGYLTLVLKDCKDSLWMSTESKLETITSLVGFLLYIAVNFLNFSPFTNIYNTSGATFILFFLSLCMQYLSVLHPALLAWKLSRTKKRLNVDEASFYLILQDPKMFQELKDEAADELCIENVLFIETLMNFYAKHSLKMVFRLHSRSSSDKIFGNEKTTSATLKTAFDNQTLTGKDIDNEVSAIYKEYLKPGSQFELNIPFTMLKEFEQKMRDINYEDIFEPIKREVLRMIYQNTFPRYVQKESKRKIKK
ncbi:hypothetical protein ROZALSC1DRAFT_28436 [Rozella allomycis CSF55]|uniref:RGS domain-containing protein n=1 Tax=Rozella allomycis (strain CSF55) TaxID=988480 RepID=A0A075B1Q4_ROZAC|nr:hypothetical protein O9G_004025 [Rozella allomycis CSF55]RKP20033.1 hypothetical protein ROZALSC1DRAFT_28436 [Rozella allomycis CSF55]|eukprot:EPZ34718.1 hypothetical protein O9G_004025 [Rozella allomycis CSF55]